MFTRFGDMGRGDFPPLPPPPPLSPGTPKKKLGSDMVKVTLQKNCFQEYRLSFTVLKFWNDLIFAVPNRVNSSFSSSVVTTKGYRYLSDSFHVGKIMYRYQNRLLSSIFLELFQASSQIHNYNTRSFADLRPHKCRTNIMQFTVLFQGPTI